MQEGRVLHKKLIIIDQETVFLGSANLTLAGMYNNNELNVQITSRSFAEDCVADYREMLNLASERNELDF
jgi:phosphatidylserine/phosphatidylglycerophosphate/cardiolipin synthase-like enzyme